METTVKTIKKVLPAVVSIIAAERLQKLEKESPHAVYSFLPGHTKGGKSKGLRTLGIFADDEPVAVSGGSGFIVSAGGLILTNRHVLDDPGMEYIVVLNDGEKLPAKVASRDPINDVAILKVEPPGGGLTAIPLGDSSKLELGESVIAIGNALGVFRNTVSLGIISGLSRSISAKERPGGRTEELRGMIQTDAAINPGNSGGPLVNLAGRAVGVNAAVVSGAQSIAFAIPINSAKRDLSDLERYGRIRRPFLGLRYIIIDEYLKKKAGLPVDYGALVLPETPHDQAVITGSPADKAGIREKDVILEFNSKKIDSEHGIQDFLDNSAVGDLVELTLLRGKNKVRVKVALIEKK